MSTETAFEGRAVGSESPAPRTHLAIFLVPMALVFAGGQLGRAIWPTLLNDAPWSLLILSSNWTRLLLVQPLVPAVVFFGIAAVRIAMLAPLYFFFGRDYGDVALRWGERKLGASSTLIPKLESYFRRFSYLLVAVWWSGIVCIMAGATGMKARLFFPILAAGTAARLLLIYVVGDALSDPITEFARFVGRYALILTPITFAITGLQLWYRRRKNRGIPIETIEEFGSELEETEAELAGEATVRSPREPD